MLLLVMMMSSFCGCSCRDITDEEDAICLLKEIIGLWLTIRGFSIAGTWLEEYKKKAAGTCKTKGLRKSLKQSETKKNNHQKHNNQKMTTLKYNLQK